MSTTAQLLIDSATNRLFVIGVDALGAKGAQFNAGDSVAVSIDDPTLATYTPDASPAADPSGIPSVQSGVIAPVAPINTGKPFNAVAQATVGGVVQPPVSLALQWQPGAATAVLEEAD